jgi:prevent-host-death family protein
MSVQATLDQRETTSVGIRALARNVSRVVAEVAQSGRPTIVTRHGEPVAALIPIAPPGREDRDLHRGDS